MTLAGHSAAAATGIVAALSADYRSAPLSEADRAMLDYAVQLTERPSSIGAPDVERLRALCFDDRAVHDICAVTAYFAFVNRIADWLGVELEARSGD